MSESSDSSAQHVGVLRKLSGSKAVGVTGGDDVRGPWDAAFGAARKGRNCWVGVGVVAKTKPLARALEVRATFRPMERVWGMSMMAPQASSETRMITTFGREMART